mmetsp:Transcript_35735/g.66654  ORF Transcript_35735/g.66654 Transcript_35735/m.66654 type:complete len:91 (+) Transcript_35735:143-415(+)
MSLSQANFWSLLRQKVYSCTQLHRYTCAWPDTSFLATFVFGMQAVQRHPPLSELLSMPGFVWSEFGLSKVQFAWSARQFTAPRCFTQQHF